MYESVAMSSRTPSSAGKWFLGTLTLGASLVLLTAFIGDPGMNLQIRCVDALARPVAGVRLEVHCPASGSGAPQRAMALGTTDDDGTLTKFGIASLSTDCSIRVVGLPNMGLQVADACSEQRLFVSSCVELEGMLVVER